MKVSFLANFRGYLLPIITRYSRPYLKWIFLSLFLAVVYSSANVLFLPLTRDIVGEISNKNLMNFSNQVVNAILLYSLRIFSMYYQSYLMTKIAMLISIDLKTDIYKKLLYLPQKFYSKWKLGDILTRLGSDAEKVRESITMLFFDIVPNLISFVGILGYLMYLNYKLTLFTMISVPLFVSLIMYMGDRLKRLSSTNQQQNADVSHIIQETLSNIKLVQAYTMEKRESKRFYRENMRVFKTFMKGIGFRNKIEGFISLSQFLVILAVIWFGGYQISEGQMTGPALASFFTGIFLVVDPILAISKVYGNFQQSMASLERMTEVMDYDGGVPNGDYHGEAQALVGHVSLSNVSFLYPDSESAALSDVTIDAKPGEIVALVGLSGAGKTTLVNLIPRFYDVTGGAISVDGRDVRDYDLRYLRSQMSIVPQEDILFRGSILENIRYGSPQATMVEVEHAAREANAWEFIEKRSRGLYAKLGDRGGRLSGGQKQRVSIARAILRNPRILILDEATSALDAQSETLVQDALNRLMKGRTTFVIAHRLSTIRHAHKIVVMSEGRIVEVGTHDELLAKGEHYQKLYKLQFGKNSEG
jgi:ATP-binding cassette, subfamily B, bacterial MsbA